MPVFLEKQDSLLYDSNLPCIKNNKFQTKKVYRISCRWKFVFQVSVILRKTISDQGLN